MLSSREREQGKAFWNICILGCTTKTLVEGQKSGEACWMWFYYFYLEALGIYLVYPLVFVVCVHTIGQATKFVRKSLH